MVEIEEFLEPWRVNHRINRYLIDHISDAGMRCTLSSRGGRDVSRQFAHLHSVRVRWLEGRAPDLAKGLKAFPTEKRPSRRELQAELSKSSAAV